MVYDDTAYFSNFSDARVYKVSVHGGEPEAITPGMFIFSHYTLSINANA